MAALPWGVGLAVVVVGAAYLVNAVLGYVPHWFAYVAFGLVMVVALWLEWREGTRNQ